jgi:hypothetical protein
VVVVRRFGGLLLRLQEIKEQISFSKPIMQNRLSGSFVNAKPFAERNAGQQQTQIPRSAVTSPSAEVQLREGARPAAGPAVRRQNSNDNTGFIGRRPNFDPNAGNVARGPAMVPQGPSRVGAPTPYNIQQQQTFPQQGQYPPQQRSGGVPQQPQQSRVMPNQNNRMPMQPSAAVPVAPYPQHQATQNPQYPPGAYGRQPMMVPVQPSANQFHPNQQQQQQQRRPGQPQPTQGGPYPQHNMNPVQPSSYNNHSNPYMQQGHGSAASMASSSSASSLRRASYSSASGETASAAVMAANAGRSSVRMSLSRVDMVRHAMIVVSLIPKIFPSRWSSTMKTQNGQLTKAFIFSRTPRKLCFVNKKKQNR